MCIVVKFFNKVVIVPFFVMDSDTANTPARLRNGQTCVPDFENYVTLSDAASDVSAGTFQIGLVSNTNFFVCKYCNKMFK